jgi:hypothetical protein
MTTTMDINNQDQQSDSLSLIANLGTDLDTQTILEIDLLRIRIESVIVKAASTAIRYSEQEADAVRKMFTANKIVSIFIKHRENPLLTNTISISNSSISIELVSTFAYRLSILVVYPKGLNLVYDCENVLPESVWYIVDPITGKQEYSEG